jgi:hypothetical protein
MSTRGRGAKNVAGVRFHIPAFSTASSKFGGITVILKDLSERQRMGAALAQVKQLSGLLPICSSCKKVRDDQK